MNQDWRSHDGKTRQRPVCYDCSKFEKALRDIIPGGRAASCQRSTSQARLGNRAPPSAMHSTARGGPALLQGTCAALRVMCPPTNLALNSAWRAYKLAHSKDSTSA